MSLPTPPGAPDPSFPYQLYPGYPPFAPPPTPQRPQRSRPVVLTVVIVTLVALVVLLPFGLIFGVSYGSRAYREWYQNELVHRVHAQRPLFEDRLSYDDGYWPVEDNAQDHRSYFYQNGAYHMKGERDDRTMWAVGARLFDDASVEATVAQRGSSAHYDGVGLLLRMTDDRRDFVVFVVRQSGEWYLSRFHYVNDDPNTDWSDLADGHNQAIQQGDDVENRLLVIMRGPVYYCFVNERYLGSYRDSGPELRGGHMGLYMNVSAVEGVFSDYVIYPAPSTDIFPKD